MSNKKQHGAKVAEWPRIRQRGSSWMVDSMAVFTKRRRVTVKTIEEAEQRAAEWRKERDEQKKLDAFERKNRAVSLANLNDTQRMEVLESYRLLSRPRGLVEAVNFFIQHSAPTGEQKTLEAVYDEYLAAKRMANRRPRTLANIERQAGPFVYENKDRPAYSITTTDVEAFIKAKAKSAVAFNIYRTALLGLFNFAMKRGAVDRNVVCAVEKASTDSGRPCIFTVKEARTLMAKASELYPELVPYIAIGLFAGLRPENELGNLDWKNINLGKGIILVTAASAKKRRDRYVEIQPNLAEWLAPHRRDAGKVYCSRGKLRGLLDRADIAWGKDIMRHSFASYHMAAFQDDAKTAKQLGHTSGSGMLYEHYKHLVEPDEAAKYWKIRPKAGNIINIKQEVA